MALKKMAKMNRVKLEKLLITIDEIDDYETLSEVWKNIYFCECPNSFGTDFIRFAIKYKIQEKLYGGLKPAIRNYLLQIAKCKKKSFPIYNPPLLPGTRIIRQWKGIFYEITIGKSCISMNGRRYKSLSAIAREITGSHINGPKFFGLRKHIHEAN